MTILENYKNIFLHPRDFAKDKLKHGRQWWFYALIVLGFNSISAYFQTFSEIPFKDALISQGVSFIFALLLIFIANQPFKRVSVSAYYRVNLAFQAFGASIYFAIGAISIILEQISYLLVIAVSILSVGILIWLFVCYCKAVSEIHKVSAWAIFGMTIIGTIVMGVVLMLLTLGAGIFIS